MGTNFLKLSFAILPVLFSLAEVSVLGFNSQPKIQSVNVKCNEREKQALLVFKHGLVDYLGLLSTWRDDENNQDCCKWRGIRCNNETGQVSMLDLRGEAEPYMFFRAGEINITSLIGLQDMEYLDLSSILGSSSNQIPKHIGSFKSLRYLNLSYMSFGGNIPYEMGNLSKLEYLDLKGNSFGGAIPSQLGRLTSLQYLDLSENYDIVGKISYQLGNLSKLQYLDLQGTSLSGEIPFHKGNLPNLRTLRLAGNFDLKVKGAEWLSTLSSLTTMDLSSLQNLGSSHHWLQQISKLIPNLRMLRLDGCSLSDNNISSLFRPHSNFSTSLTILDLSENMLTSSTLESLLNFPSLVSLDLSFNNLSSSIFLGNFNFSSKLQELSLAQCSLTDKSFLVPPSSVKNSSSSLFTLNFGGNLLKSSAIFFWLFNSTINLGSLNLLENMIEGSIPDEFGIAMNSLEALDLSSNKLHLASLGNLCSLKELYLSNNSLSGEISSFFQNSSWCKEYMFQILDLSNNKFTGMLPNLSILTSLRRLDLSGNQLSGEIPKSIGLLYELESLHMEENHLEGDINETHFSSLSKLLDLDLTDNSLSLKFSPNWVPPFQLFNLGLASCKLGPGFPNWLKTQNYLSFLDISNAGIDDFVPDWLWNKLESITEMNMSYNSLKGKIQNLPIKLADEAYVMLNSNQFEGAIPAFLSQASTLDLSKNKISDFNAFLCKKSQITSMRTLDLSNNHIMGQLPDCWEQRSSLKFLDLSNNRLVGKIPQSMADLFNLEALVLRNNSLIGELPFTLKNCTNLIILDVSENLLFGPIPSWIGENLQQLKILSLRVNHFSGSLPSHLCYLWQIHLLDLSRNNISEGIPTCIKNFTAMTERSIISSGDIVRKRKISSEESYSDIYESNVLLMWKYQEHVYLNPEILLKTIDLSSNSLTGEMPKEIGYLLGLVSLNLSRNYLSGEIPSEIGNLNSLDFLDLSRNNFSGKILSTLSKIDRLSVLYLSNNSLSGRIPLGIQLQTFAASAFEGNSGLCGEPLNISCPGDVRTVKPEESEVDDEDVNSVFYEALFMSLGVGFFVGFWGFIGPMLLWPSGRKFYQRFLNRFIE